MKYFKLFFFTIISLLLLNSCSDEPKSKINYKNLRISRMDLSGAVSIGLSQGSTDSRAIDGELASAGMYKIDANGKITAVGVYFTTDVDGNRLDHEESLRVAPKAVFKLTDNFILAIQCDYYDVEGDLVQNKFEVIDDEHTKLIPQEVPYKDLLVRISDGKIWCVDEIYSTYLYNRNNNNYDIKNRYYNSDNRGNIYLNVDMLWDTSNSGIFKFNLENNNYTFEQIDKGNGFKRYGIFVYGNGVVFTGDSDLCHFSMLWPNGGFQEIDPLLLEGMDNISRAYLIPSVNVPRLLTYGYSSREEILAKISDITFSDEPGSFGLGESISLRIDEFELADNWEASISTPQGQFYEDNEKILISYTLYLTDKKNPYITAKRYGISLINKKTNQWNNLTETESLVYFGDAYQGKIYEYEGKIWSIKDDGNTLGGEWFDLSTLETGFVKFNFVKPDYMKNRSDYISQGYIEFSGVNPSTGNMEMVYINITTGEEKWTEYEPERLLKYLIPLN